MKIIEPSYKIITTLENIEQDMNNINDSARLSHRSVAKTKEDRDRLIKSLIRMRHLSPLEFGVVAVKITCDRAVANELVRHRLATFCQESTRYCNYTKDKFGNEITVVRPSEFEEGSEEYKRWEECCRVSEATYFQLLNNYGTKPENARAVLPLSLATKISMSTNYREWRHVFQLRTAKAAHPDMRKLMIPMLENFKKLCPCVFEDIEPNK